MKVVHILQAKGAAVFAVRTTASITEAIDILGEKNIGAVVVKDEKETVVGILSERDIVRRLRTEGPIALTKTVSAYMTPNPFTCSLEAEIDQVLGRMTDKRIRHLPVCENGELVGIVSIGDVVKWKIENVEREAAALREYICS